MTADPRTTLPRSAKLANEAATALFNAEYPEGMESEGMFSKASVEKFHIDCWANMLRPFFESACVTDRSHDPFPVSPEAEDA